MRVLWVANVPAGDAPLALGLPPNHFGGWLDGLLGGLQLETGIELAVAFPLPRAEQALVGASARVTYYGFSPQRADSHLDAICAEFTPEIVHIFGTEMSHSLDAVNVANSRGIPVVVQLQGLMKAIDVHQDGGLRRSVSRGGSIIDCVRGRPFRRLRGAVERERRILREVHHVIGRTEFDKAIALGVNSDLLYHHCNETLRNQFYTGQWRLENCDKHTLFFSQATTPLKGLHIVLLALSEVRTRIPTARLRIAGPRATERGVRAWLRRTPYSRYLLRMIAALQLEEAIEWVGVMDAASMKREFLRSHVFISSSFVENESNSLSEAMLLGMPCIASYVGGVPDRLRHGRNGLLYQSDAFYMLAHQIVRVLSSDSLAQRLGAAARDQAQITNDQSTNANATREVYDLVLKSNGPLGGPPAGTFKARS